MNVVNLIGRLTREPEVRVANTNNGQMNTARYSLAIDRPGKSDGTDFINCVAFGGGADFAEKYLKKGMKIGVTGTIRTGSYEKDGRKVYTTDVVVRNHYFCESKSNQGDTSTNDIGGNNTPFGFEEMDNTIPF